MGPGHPDIESERPRSRKSGRYTDTDAAGQSTTLIDVPDDHPQLAVLLRNGSIQPLPPKLGKGVADGKDSG